MIMSTHCGAGVSCKFSRWVNILTELITGDDDMDADEKKDVKILHPKFGA